MFIHVFTVQVRINSTIGKYEQRKAVKINLQGYPFDLSTADVTNLPARGRVSILSYCMVRRIGLDKDGPFCHFWVWKTDVYYSW